ncbi:MAG: phosphate acetyltransferase [Actinobacteria bacterium]|nr:phosphate acetyltransferase [Actinomycetota bacterium]
MPARWLDLIRGRQASVVFPDAADARVLAAAARLVSERLAQPVLIGRSEELNLLAADAGERMPEGVEVVDPEEAAADVDLDVALRRVYADGGGVLSDAEARRLLADPLILGMLLVRAGRVDACVAGNRSRTSDVLRAGIRVLGVAEGIDTVSGSFLLTLPDGRMVTYGDCAVLPDPDAEQLAAVAIASAATHEILTGEQPIVAMLSFSTKASAEHASVEKVRRATGLACRRRPDLEIDGELQFDAAIDQQVAAAKAPGSRVAGRANVFVFPNLDAGNIAYKLTQRLGHAQAYGPLLQGLAHPLSDLSRGCSTDDIVAVAIITALQGVGSGDSRRCRSKPERKP